MSDAGRTDHEEAVRCRLGRFRQGQGERELCLEAAGRKVATVVELSRVGHPFVDQNHARNEGVEQAAKGVAGARPLLVVGRDTGVRVAPAKLPGEFSPKRSDHSAVRLSVRSRGRDLVADQDYPPTLR